MAARWLGSTLALLAGVGLTVACGGADPSTDPPTPATDDTDTSFVDDGADANAVETDAQLLVSSLVSSIESKTFGEGAKAIFLPRSCVKVENNAASATAVFTFDGCLGPNGLRGVSGTLAAKYAIEADRVALDVTGTGVTLNDAASVAFTARATVTVDGSDRSMAWKSSISGRTAGNRSFSRENQFVTTWKLGEACFGLDGTSEGQVKDRDLKVEVEGYARCRRGCPEAGGKIRVTNVAKSRTVAISYDGTNRATFTNAKGKDTTIQLLCVP